MVRYSRWPGVLRGVALAAALSVGVSESGLPMCLSLMSQAAAPCRMHGQHHEDGAHHEAAQSVQLTSPASSETCHPDATGAGCAAGGACPSGGPATAASVQAPVVAQDVTPTVLFGPALSYLSYLAPPLTPPPQA